MSRTRSAVVRAIIGCLARCHAFTAQLSLLNSAQLVHSLVTACNNSKFVPLLLLVSDSTKKAITALSPVLRHCVQPLDGLPGASLPSEYHACWRVFLYLRHVADAFGLSTGTTIPLASSSACSVGTLELHGLLLLRASMSPSQAFVRVFFTCVTCFSLVSRLRTFALGHLALLHQCVCQIRYASPFQPVFLEQVSFSFRFQCFP